MFLAATCSTISNASGTGQLCPEPSRDSAGWPALSPDQLIPIYQGTPDEDNGSDASSAGLCFSRVRLPADSLPRL
jgi:hypothetical protein